MGADFLHRLRLRGFSFAPKYAPYKCNYIQTYSSNLSENSGYEPKNAKSLDIFRKNKGFDVKNLRLSILAAPGRARTCSCAARGSARRGTRQDQGPMRPRDATPKPGKENPMPRPTKYDPSYCDKAIEWGFNILIRPPECGGPSHRCASEPGNEKAGNCPALRVSLWGGPLRKFCEWYSLVVIQCTVRCLPYIS